MPSRTITAILGMHRSGTSCLAGSLQQMGLYLGTVFEWSPHNRKGNRENAEIMQLNESVLKASGGSWDRPPAHVRWSAEQAERRDAIIGAGTRGGANWGFKDPRTLLTLPFWQDAAVDMKFVGTFRHPGLVARSLEARNGFPIEAAFSLWQRHNEVLLTCQRQFAFPLVSFDVSADEYLEAVKRASDYLQLPGPRESGGEPPFLDDQLRHQDRHATELPGDVEALYGELVDVYRRQVAGRSR